MTFQLGQRNAPVESSAVELARPRRLRSKDAEATCGRPRDRRAHDWESRRLPGDHAGFVHAIGCPGKCSDVDGQRRVRSWIAESHDPLRRLRGLSHRSCIFPADIRMANGDIPQHAPSAPVRRDLRRISIVHRARLEQLEVRRGGHSRWPQGCSSPGPDPSRTGWPGVARDHRHQSLLYVSALPPDSPLVFTHAR
jgi:hypothetical protein